MNEQQPVGLTAEDEIRSMLERRRQALLDQDLDAYRALFAPNFSHRSIEGEDQDAAAFFEQTRQRWEPLREFRDLDISIESLRTIDAENEALVISNQRFTVVRSVSGGGTEQLRSSFYRRENWQRTGTGWEIRRIEELEQGPVEIDGRVVEGMEYAAVRPG